VNALSEQGAEAQANIDPREVRHYEQLAQSWWDLSGPFWPLHRLNAVRTQYLRRVLAPVFGRRSDDEQPLQDLRLLDVGCGGGILSEAMARLGAQVHGIDVVGKSIEVARQHALNSALEVRYENASAATLVGREPGFDVVLNMEVVEHVPDVAALVNDCSRLLRPGGVLVVATINRSLLAWFFAILGAEYVLRWLPRGTHRWRQFVTPTELEALLNTAGLDVVERTGVRVNPFNRHFALTNIMAVNYMLVARSRATPLGSS